MLTDSDVLCDSITTSVFYEPRSHVGSKSRSQLTAELYECVDKAVARRRIIKDTREQWYAIAGVQPSSQDSQDSATRCRVRVSIVVEERQVEYAPVIAPSLTAPGPSTLRASSGNANGGK